MSRSTAAKAARFEATADGYTAFNPWRELCLQMPSFVDTVYRVRQQAIDIHEPGRRNASHRGYYVGGLTAAFSYAPGESSLVSYADTNTKPLAHSEGICAELRTTRRVERDNRKSDQPSYEPFAIVVMGEPQPDQATGYTTGTLFMCSERCWPKIIEPGKIATDALIITVRPDKRWAQVQTAGELDAFYSALKRGEHPREPSLVDHLPGDWEGIVHRFDELVPRDIEPMHDPGARALSVEAAMIAIQGGYGRLHAA
ncbi:hypothetical protein KC957_02080 [Candidatus Saccharibacteria bacterium]|nr:hypothetical protein [Candidatus Saccharibacteria bacterium]